MKLRKMFALSRAVGRNEIEKVESLCSEALAADQRDLMAEHFRRPIIRG